MPKRKSVPYRHKELFGAGPQRTHRGRQLDEIAFPLGGLGTGSISLGGWGQLRDWEVRNRPAKGRTLPNAFFSVRVQEEGKAPEVRVLQGPKGGSYNQGGHTAGHDTAEGLPHFHDVAFRGEFPFALVQLRDADFPLEADLVAFSPFIPLNDRDSSLPVAVLTYTVRNCGKRPLQVSLLGNLTNDIGEAAGRTNKARKGGGFSGLFLANSQHSGDDARCGSMVLATPAADAWVWPAWHDGRILKFWEAVAWEGQWPPTRKGASHSGHRRCGLRTRPRRGGDRALPPRLALPQLPPLAAMRRRGAGHLEELVRHPVGRRLGGGLLHRQAPRPPGRGDATLPRDTLRLHSTRGRSRRDQQPTVDPAHQHLPASHRRHLLRLRGLQ